MTGGLFALRLPLRLNLESGILARDERDVLELDEFVRTITETYALDLRHAHVFESKLSLSQTCIPVVPLVFSSYRSIETVLLAESSQIVRAKSV